MTETINDQILDMTLRTHVRGMQFGKTLDLQIQGNLYELSNDLAAQINEADVEGALPRFQEPRMQRLKVETDSLISQTYAKNAKTLSAGLQDLAVFQQTSWVAGANKIFSANVFDVTLTPRELRVLARDPVVLGLRTSEQWRTQSENTKRRFVQQMRLGNTQGETNTQLVDRIIGKKTGAKRTVEVASGTKKVPIRTGGVMQVSEREARSLVRTSVQTVSNRVLEETYRENDSIVKGIAVIVTLDGRTTHICMSLSGGVWDMKGDPLGESAKQIPYPGPAPYHYQCRTVITPVTKSWEELGATTKGQINKTAPDSVRASMGGQVPGRQTYDQWLKKQDVAFQKEQLGSGTWKLWDAGDIKLSQLTDSTLKPRTLVELQALV